MLFQVTTTHDYTYLLTVVICIKGYPNMTKPLLKKILFSLIGFFPLFFKSPESLHVSELMVYPFLAALGIFADEYYLKNFFDIGSLEDQEPLLQKLGLVLIVVSVIHISCSLFSVKLPLLGFSVGLGIIVNTWHNLSIDDEDSSE